MNPKFNINTLNLSLVNFIFFILVSYNKDSICLNNTNKLKNKESTNQTGLC